MLDVKWKRIAVVRSFWDEVDWWGTTGETGAWVQVWLDLQERKLTAPQSLEWKVHLDRSFTIH